MGTQGMTPWVAPPTPLGFPGEVQNYMQNRPAGMPTFAPQAPNFNGASTDPSVYTTTPYDQGLNQNVYANQANNGLAPGFTQDQYNADYSANMQPGGNFNPAAFNSGLGINGTGVISPQAATWAAQNPGQPSSANPWLNGTYTPPANPVAPAPPSPGVGQLLTSPSQVTSVNDLIHNPLAGGGSATTAPGAQPTGQLPGGGSLNMTFGGAAPAAGQGGGLPNTTGPGGNPPPGLMQLLQSLFGTPPASTASSSAAAPAAQTNPFTPAPVTTTITTPGQTDATAAPAANGFPSAPDQALASNVPNIGYLQNIAANGGNPVNATPAWQAMIDAQQRQIQEGQANLDAQFDTSGERFSTAYGTAATDYQNQAILNQNSLLGQMTLQAQTDAQNRNLTASGQLANISQGSTSQLSSQDFNAEMLRMQQAYGAAQTLAGTGASAASQLSSAGTTGADLMAQLGATGATSLLGGSITGAQGLFGAENNAASSMFGAENLAGLTASQQQIALQQLGITSASDLSNLWNQNLQTGSALGQQQYTNAQSQINNLYQEFLRTQPQYNPTLSYQAQGAYANPALYYPYFQPSQLGSILGGVGGLLGGGSSLIGLLGSLFGSGSGGGGINIPFDPTIGMP